MIDVFGLPVVVAQGAPIAPPSLLSQLWPFAVMLLIFYFIVLMPMRKRQKKVAEFQSSLKVGDKVTVDGYPGKVVATRGNARSVVLADGRSLFAGTADDLNSAAPETRQ